MLLQANDKLAQTFQVYFDVYESHQMWEAKQQNHKDNGIHIMPPTDSGDMQDNLTKGNGKGKQRDTDNDDSEYQNHHGSFTSGDDSNHVGRTGSTSKRNATTTNVDGDGSSSSSSSRSRSSNNNNNNNIF